MNLPPPPRRIRGTWRLHVHRLLAYSWAALWMFLLVDCSFQPLLTGLFWPITIFALAFTWQSIPAVIGLERARRMESRELRNWIEVPAEVVAIRLGKRASACRRQHLLITAVHFMKGSEWRVTVRHCGRVCLDGGRHLTLLVDPDEPRSGRLLSSFRYVRCVPVARLAAACIRDLST